jgi:hypothetical protein
MAVNQGDRVPGRGVGELEHSHVVGPSGGCRPRNDGWPEPEGDEAHHGFGGRQLEPDSTGDAGASERRVDLVAQPGLGTHLDERVLGGKGGEIGRLVRRFPVRVLLLAGLVASAVVLFGVVAGTTLGLLAVLPPQFLVVASRGLVSANATDLGVKRAPAAGAASAVLGARMFGGGILVSPFIALGGEGSAVPMAAVVAIGAVAALAATAALTRRLLRLRPIRAFSELTDDADLVAELEEVYQGDVEKLDLTIGMFAEKRPAGFAFSDTAFRIFILMASRRLNSDRFFASDYDAKVYTEAGVKWIDAATMTRVLLRHWPQLASVLPATANAFQPWPVAAHDDKRGRP